MRLSKTMKAGGFAIPLALLMTTAAWAQSAQPATPGTATTDQATQDERGPAIPLRSRADLDTWIRQHADEETPFDRMPPGARIRFLAGLGFNERGLTGFDPTDLGISLSPADIRTVLALFLSGPELDFWAGRIKSTRTEAIETLVTAPISVTEARFNKLYLFQGSLGRYADSERGRILASRYEALFPDAAQPTRLRAANDYDLRLLYRAAVLANYYAPDPTAADAMARTLDAMDARGIATPDETGEARDALLAAHRFDAARRFTQEHAAAHLPPLPRFQGADADLGDRPSLWRYDGSSDTMTRVPVDLAPLQILVLAGCHFSVDAANDITADPLLGPMFRQHARWLSLPPGPEDLQAVRDWNHDRPNAPMEMLYARDEWSMFSRWAMPTFYVVQDGKVVGSVIGWSPTSRDELTALLRRTGLMSAAAPDASPAGDAARADPDDQGRAASNR